MWLGSISYLKVLNGTKMYVKMRKMTFPESVS